MNTAMWDVGVDETLGKVSGVVDAVLEEERPGPSFAETR